ncbi:hypothetical protein Tcan_06648 [Toxocara canis]|uniref:Secreted protein n=1 Tax=Toxocara canis TaxID=6265 RepID=A0A0B2W023_TOXCA|nr:hypothetical protein Tcan_06648 [Toxocara canis]
MVVLGGLNFVVTSLLIFGSERSCNVYDVAGLAANHIDNNRGKRSFAVPYLIVGVNMECLVRTKRVIIAGGSNVTLASAVRKSSVDERHPRHKTTAEMVACSDRCHERFRSG